MNGPVSFLTMAYLGGEATCEVRRVAANHPSWSDRKLLAWAKDWARDTCEQKGIDYRLLEVSITRIPARPISQPPVVHVQLADVVTALGQVSE